MLRSAGIALVVAALTFGCGRAARVVPKGPVSYKQWTLQNTWTGPADNVFALSFSNDGNLLAAGGGPLRPEWRELKVWEVETGRERLAWNNPGPTIHSLAFSPDAKLLAVSGTDPQSAFVQDLTGADRGAFITVRGEGDVVFAADGELYLAIDGALWRWDLKQGTKHQVSGELTTDRHLAISLDGTRIALGNRVLDAKTGKVIVEIPNESVGSIALTPDGTRLGTTGQKTTAKIWDAETGRYLFSLEAPDALALAISRDGKAIATGHSDGYVRVWDAATGKQLAELRGHKRMVLSVAFSPDGRLLASGDRRGEVRIWEAGSDSP
jgi:WD40 repeat protein